MSLISSIIRNQKLITSRCLSTSTWHKNKLQTREKLEWTVAVQEAERVVGYSTSFLNLRWLLNDEMANIATHMKKLIASEHPLVEIAKNFIFKTDAPAWGLVVLLVSKLARLKLNQTETDFDKVAGILHSQRILAEVTEMIRTSIVIHKGLIQVEGESETADNLNYGNKIALLCGDCLLSKSFHELATLKNHEVNEIISSTLRDLAEAEFLGPRDNQNNPIPAQLNPARGPHDIFNETNFDLGPYKINEILGNPKHEWILRSILGGGNLLAKSCQAALLLGKQTHQIQKEGFLFGKHLALAWQAKLDLELFNRSEKFSLIGAPVMLHLERHPDFYDELKRGEDRCDFNKIKNLIKNGTALQETRELQEEFMRRASNNLKDFETNSAKDSLIKIISAM